jgi:hypothetical protein
MMKKHIVKKVLAGMLGLFLASAASAADINSRIFEFQKKLAADGNVQAQFKLAFMYEVGRGVQKDMVSAREWYKKSAAQNFEASKRRLKFLDVVASGFKPEHRTWVSEQIKDANDGDAEAMFIVAELYEAGIGVEADLLKARHYYKLSTGRGNANAEARLFKLEQKIFTSNKQQKQKVQQAEKQAEQQAEARDAEAADKRAEEQRQRALQAKVAEENRRLAIERRKIEDEKRRIEQQKQELAKREAEAARAKAERARAEKEKAEQAKAEAKKEEVFEADNCTGAAARFRTQCN